MDIQLVKGDPRFSGSEIHKSKSCSQWKLDIQSKEADENQGSDTLHSSRSDISMLDQAQLPTDDISLSSASPLCPEPVCRQFWKAGSYDESFASKAQIQNSKNYLQVHPKFLHSNATSHKWAFGAVAELLDNAIDEIQNGATFVVVDRISNVRDGSPALLIQDDGGGMDPEAIRRCMSFGFSDKKSKTTIGQYGNGFKTSTMRLGADVIVFSRHVENRTSTLSIGLLSYTYLTRTCLDRIVVPMVDYEINISSGKLEPLHRCGGEHFLKNLSVLLQWSPYATEAELIKQFDDIGFHGTKVIIYNLWQDDDGELEFDFEMDPQDICIQGPNKSEESTSRMLIKEHIGHQYRYSLHAYLSILYLRLPQNFRMVLRGRIVAHHNIVNDLKYVEVILYKPQTGGTVEGQVITSIGFLKGAPKIAIHGFNVYHKNRLILPFWHVLSYANSSRGRGVVGVLEANFVEPTHNKQDFEKTSLFQKLENRLKDMTLEYWDYHCGLVGYQVQKKTPRASIPSEQLCYDVPKHIMHEPVRLNWSSNIIGSQNGAEKHVVGMRTPQLDSSLEPQRVKRRAGQALDGTGAGLNLDTQVSSVGNHLKNQEAVILMEQRKKLRAECFEHEKMEEQLHHEIERLRLELEESRKEYARMSQLQLHYNSHRSFRVANSGISFAKPGLNSAPPTCTATSDTCRNQKVTIHFGFDPPIHVMIYKYTALQKSVINICYKASAM